MASLISTDVSDANPGNISAYFSLEFPTITYFLQTPVVTIGRRPKSAKREVEEADSAMKLEPDISSGPSTAEVDVDLGPMKSVSRLHAKIEYDDEQERFVIQILGRNGALVDNAWHGCNKRVPLSDRSTIEIATRKFIFHLPPTTLPHTPPPSTPSTPRGRSLSVDVDITTVSPNSTPPSPSPPLAPELLKAKGKKRKKPPIDAPTTVETPRPRPEDIPPRPHGTYAVLCYRAIKALGGRASLQDICAWLMETYPWFRHNTASGWEGTVRHSLSSERAFVKSQRRVDEPGKGYVWSIDKEHEHSLVERDEKAQQQQLAAANAAKASPAGPLPFNQQQSSMTIPPIPPKAPKSKKGAKDSKLGAALPPLLTKAPHPSIAAAAAAARIAGTALSISSRPMGPAPIAPATSGTMPYPTSGIIPVPIPGTTSVPGIPLSSDLPPSVRIPIVIGQLPPGTPPGAGSSTTTSAMTAQQLAATPPIMLLNDTLVLNPTIFGHMPPQELKRLEALGPQKALDILQSYMAAFIKERIKRETAKGRGRGRPRKNKPAGTPAHTGASISTALPINAVNGIVPFTQPSGSFLKTPAQLSQQMNISNQGAPSATPAQFASNSTIASVARSAPVGMDFEIDIEGDGDLPPPKRTRVGDDAPNQMIS